MQLPGSCNRNILYNRCMSKRITSAGKEINRDVIDHLRDLGFSATGP